MRLVPPAGRLPEAEQEAGCPAGAELRHGQGELLHSQDTAKLEKGKSYHARGFKRFLTRWGPRGSGPPGRRSQ